MQRFFKFSFHDQLCSFSPIALLGHVWNLGWWAIISCPSLLWVRRRFFRTTTSTFTVSECCLHIIAVNNTPWEIWSRWYNSINFPRMEFTIFNEAMLPVMTFSQIVRAMLVPSYSNYLKHQLSKREEPFKEKQSVLLRNHQSELKSTVSCHWNIIRSSSAIRLSRSLVISHRLLELSHQGTKLPWPSLMDYRRDQAEPFRTMCS